MTILNNGNVGVGTTVPGASNRLHVYSGTDGQSLFRHSSGHGGVTITGDAAASSANLTFANNYATSISEEYRVWLNGADDGLYFSYGASPGSTATNHAMVMTSTGNVGIGTTAPFGKLHVSTGDLVMSNGQAVSWTDSSGQVGRTGIFGREDTDYIAIKTDNQERLRVINDGSVGIGTTNPQRKFVIQQDHSGGLTNTALYNADLTNNNEVILSFRSDSSGVGASSFVEAGSISTIINEHDNATFDSSLTFYTRNGTSTTEKMRITNSGDIGVGTTAPTSALHISKSNTPASIFLENTDGSAGGTYPSLIQHAYNAGHASLVGGRAGGTSSTPTVAGTDLTLQTVVGRAHDGTSFQEVGRISVKSGDGFGAGAIDGKIEFQVRDNNVANTAMVIQETGNVGIGSNAPTSKLDVNGTVTATAFSGDGSALTGVSASDSSAGTSSSNYIINTDSDNAGSDGGVDIQTNGATVARVTASGSVQSAGGSAGTPGLSFTGDTDTGVFTPSANTLSMSAGGIEALRLNTVASGVNYVEITPAATGNGPIIAAAGSDTNIDLNITPKGTGDTIFTNGNVGIGTTTPEEILHIDNGTTATSRNIIKFRNGGWGTPGPANATSSDGTKLDLFSAGNQRNSIGMNSSGDMWFRTGGSQLSGFRFYTASTDSGTPSERFTISNSGNVGIGSTSPRSALDVSAGVLRTNSYMALGRGVNNNDQITFNLVPDNAGNYTPAWAGSAGAGGAIIGMPSGGNGGLTFHTTRFGTDGTTKTIASIPEAMRITDDGDVGIGVNTPAQKLEVAGTVLAGDQTSTQGALQFAGRYSGDDIINTYGSYYASGSTVIGYAVKPKTGSTGYVSSADNVAFQRSLISLDDSIEFATAPLASVAVDADVTMTTHMTINNTGNVGIGTSTPAAKLHVQGGTIRAEHAGNIITQTNVQATLIDSDSSNMRLNMTVDKTSNGGNGAAALQATESGVSNDRALLFNPHGGNVGLGNFQPEEKLHLTGGNLRLEFSTVDGNQYGFIGSTDQIHMTENAKYSSVGGWESIEGSHTAVSIQSHANGGRAFLVSTDDTVTAADEALTWTERFAILNTGNVGIGTGNPTQDMHVYSTGESFSLMESTTANDVGYRFRNSHGNAVAYLNDDSHFYLWNQINGANMNFRTTTSGGVTNSNQLVLLSDGKVGIGAAAPERALEVAGDIKMYQPGGNSFFTAHNSSNTETLRMSTNGNSFFTGGSVGIGTTTPAHNLHVIGTAGLSTGTAWTNTSDRRLKDIRGAYEYGLDEILQLKTVRFNYKKGNPLGLPHNKEITGFIAQEVQQVIPEAVVERDDGYLELNVDPIHWATVNAVQDLYGLCEMSQEQKDKLKAQVDQLVANDRKQDRAIASLQEKTSDQVDSIRSELQQKDQKISDLEQKLQQKDSEIESLQQRLNRIEELLLKK